MEWHDSCVAGIPFGARMFKEFSEQPVLKRWPQLLFCAGLFLTPHPGYAASVALKVEPDVAIPLSAPQSERFGIGGGESLKLLLAITPWLDVGPTASVQLLPALTAGEASGVTWAFGGGLVLKRSHEAEKAGVSPWVDADLFYVRTGALNRPGFDAAVGLAVPIGERRTVWVGPFVRYQQVMQTPDRDGFDNRDSRTLALGLSFEVGPGLAPPPPPPPVVVPEVVPCPTCPTCPVAAPVCPDRDQDGLPDKVDHCPDVVGLIPDWGCPVYANFVVHKDTIELREKIFFAYDQATIEQVSYRVLDDVVMAMKNDPSFHVDIRGHTDSKGSDVYNQDLSERRAAAVVDYLVAHGVARDRLTSAGFGESIPLETNATAAGREKNRRVEFLVKPMPTSDGSAK